VSDRLDAAIQGVKEELEAVAECADDAYSADWNEGYRRALQDTLDNLNTLDRVMPR
jgi:hypothetical protein